ncbi:MAG: hypothetical protein ACOZCO_03885 [Bacteroidota bacterium]
MKKIIVFTLFFASATHLFSQATWGAQAFTSLYSYDPKEPGVNECFGYGFGGGVSAVFPISKKWTFRNQLNLQNMIYSVHSEFVTENYYSSYKDISDYDYNEKFIDIFPEIMWESNSGFGVSFGPRANIGFSQSYKYDRKETYTDLQNNITDELLESGKGKDASDFRDWSFCLGISYKISESFRVESKFQYTFTNLSLSIYTPASAEYKAQLQLGVSYVFKPKTDSAE